MLSVNHLCKSFGKLKALEDISFELKMGSITAVLGPSGSGKSTLLRGLGRLEPIDSGAFAFQGENLFNLSPGFMGMVFQAFNLFPHLTILQNLVHAPVCLKRVTRKEAENQAKDWLDTFNLADKAGQFPNQLSGGQKQRVAIARMMMMDPPIILFDEPTSALDPEMVTEVATLIHSLKSPSRLIITATHELRLAKLAADQILFLDQGRLVENVPKDVFFTQPKTPRAKLFLKNLTEYQGI